MTNRLHWVKLTMFFERPSVFIKLRWFPSTTTGGSKHTSVSFGLRKPLWVQRSCFLRNNLTLWWRNSEHGNFPPKTASFSLAAANNCDTRQHDEVSPINRLLSRCEHEMNVKLIFLQPHLAADSPVFFADIWALCAPHISQRRCTWLQTKHSFTCPPPKTMRCFLKHCPPSPRPTV